MKPTVKNVNMLLVGSSQLNQIGPLNVCNNLKTHSTSLLFHVFQILFQTRLDITL